MTASEMPLNRPPDYARLTWLDDDTLRLLRRSESQLKSLPACVFAYPSLSPSIAQAPEVQTILRKLRHPLSSEAMSNAFGESYFAQYPQRFLHAQQRTAIEIAALREFGDAVSQAVLTRDAAFFVSALEMLASHFLGVPSGAKVKVRVASVNILPDKHGAYWQCVPASEVIARLEELHRFIRESVIETPMLTAIVALVQIAAIHPFGNSNGRVSRVLFNGLLQASALNRQTFIPLKEIYELSEFGFEIRLRHCMRFNEWSQIMRYFSDAVELCAIARTCGEPE